MLYYWVPEQFCAIEGVCKLPAGSWARLRPDGRIQVEHYWQIADVARAAAAGPAPDLGQVIEESVAAHLVADVPVSSFLSGGLDSSIITVLAHRAAQEIDAYTITFRPEDQRLEAMPDDAVYARKVAAQFGVKLHEIEISPDIVDLLPRMVDTLDEPIGDPAAINTLLMCQAARERGVKVILSGMGADELFGGYRKHQACVLASQYGRLPGPARAGMRFAVNRVPVSIGGRGLRYARWAKRFLTFAELPEEPRFRRSYTLYDPDDLAGLLSPDLRSQVDWVVDGHRVIYTDNDLHDEVNRMCLADAAAVPARPQPVLLRPVQHGRLGRGPGAVRGPGRGAGGVRHPGPGQDPEPAGQGRAQAGRGEVAPARDRLPAQGLLQRRSRMGPHRPEGGHQRRRLVTVSLSAPG